MKEFYLIFPLWFCELLKPIEYKTDKDYGEGYYGHWCGYPVYYVPNEIPEERKMLKDSNITWNYHEISPQTCDLGFSTGEYILNKPATLEEVLYKIQNTFRSWGTITIFYPNKDICRIFDYDLYNDKQFYHNLSGWEYNFKVSKITSRACFMNEDITIELTN